MCFIHIYIKVDVFQNLEIIPSILTWTSLVGGSDKSHCTCAGEDVQ